MAGIGFELQRALRGGGMSSVFKVVVAGLVIVAGPWLVSIVAIGLIGRFAAPALAEGRDAFVGVIAWTYAFSLVLSGGFHYVFTRYIADLLYEGERKRAISALFGALVPASAVFLAVAVPVALTLSPSRVAWLPLFRAGVAIVFVSVNVIWLETLVVTLLKRQTLVLTAYAAGMAVSVFASAAMGGSWGLGGAVLGFSAGQVVIALLLALALVLEEWPSRCLSELKPLLSYFRKFPSLFLAGVMYSAGIWADKIVYWFTRGTSADGTWIRLYERYDVVAYMANLSAIPGLAWFMIASETGFFLAIRRFLVRAPRATLSRLLAEKYALTKAARRALFDLISFQGIVSVVLMALAPLVAKALVGEGIDILSFRITLAGVFFHVVFLASFTFLFYVEKHGHACAGAVIFALTSAALAFSSLPPGASYLISCAVSAIYCSSALFYALANFDRFLYGGR